MWKITYIGSAGDQSRDIDIEDASIEGIGAGMMSFNFTVSIHCLKLELIVSL